MRWSFRGADTRGEAIEILGQSSVFLVWQGEPCSDGKKRQHAGQDDENEWDASLAGIMAMGIAAGCESHIIRRGDALRAD